ncbi:PIN domain-containing protein [Sphingomonas endolithica]|uniref:PIN domain-containing protein n=1 Tax=Sphingomonas endolithica TaxID=2972485 RepID=UPI0021B061BA|nr:PIN domain-containing protein [Sphingomonas sp. ZFBP2030]
MERRALMFLLDTDVVAELRRGASADAAVAAWAGGMPREHLFLSAVSLLDLENAAARSPRDKVQAVRLQRWIDEQVLPAFDGRILPVDAAVIRRRRGLTLDARDALIAATALEQGLTVATRAGAAFRGVKIKLLDPWKYAREEDTDWRQASRGEPHWLKSLFVRA